MVALLCFVLNTILFIITYERYKNIFAPPVVLNLMWGFVNLLNFFLGWNSNEIEYLILSLPALMFTIGFYFSTSKLRTNAAVNNDTTYAYSKLTTYLIVSVVIILSLYYFNFMFSRIGTYYSGNLWYTLRRIVWAENTKEIGIFNYPSIPLYLLPTILIFSLKKKKHRYIKISLILVLLMAFIWSVISTSRTQTFMLIFITLMSQIVYRFNNYKLMSLSDKRKRKRLIVFSGILILVVFIYISTQKNPDAYGETSGLSFALKSIANYTNLSSACFVEWFKGGFKHRNGLNSFRLIYAVLRRLGMDVDVVNTTSGGTFINFQGYTSNAFTVARNYVEDFGIFYMAFILLLFGLIHGLTYKKAICSQGRKKIRFSIICGVLYIPLMYQILTDQYLNVLSQWIQYIIWVYVLTSKRLFRETKTEIK